MHEGGRVPGGRRPRMASCPGPHKSWSQPCQSASIIQFKATRKKELQHSIQSPSRTGKFDTLPENVCTLSLAGLLGWGGEGGRRRAPVFLSPVKGPTWVGKREGRQACRKYSVSKEREGSAHSMESAGSRGPQRLFGPGRRKLLAAATNSLGGLELGIRLRFPPPARNKIKGRIVHTDGV